MDESELPDQPGLFDEPEESSFCEPGSNLVDHLVLAGWGLPDPDDDPDAWLAGLPADIAAEVAARPVVTAAPWEGPAAARGAFAGGGWCDGMPPGWFPGQLLAEATGEGYARLDDDQLAGVLRACQRQISGGYAGLAGVVAEVAERRAAGPARPGWPGLGGHVAGELAAELTLTGRSAGRLLEVAAGLRRLPGVRGALAGGAVDWARACVFVDELSVLGDEAAAEVADRLAERAAGWTTGQLRAVLAAGPAAAQRRRDEGRRDARVEVWREPSGNAALAGRRSWPGCPAAAWPASCRRAQPSALPLAAVTVPAPARVPGSTSSSPIHSGSTSRSG
ncbi:MAG TPA: hypothetical protein VEJ42_05610 [Streptosporangiaceae bacterium]|nr:hypothetical protein [Streptosporangiaceae bacterium]